MRNVGALREALQAIGKVIWKRTVRLADYRQFSAPAHTGDNRSIDSHGHVNRRGVLVVLSGQAKGGSQDRLTRCEGQQRWVSGKVDLCG